MKRVVLVSVVGSLVVPSVARGDPPSLLDRAVVAEAARRAVERAGLGPERARALASRARSAAWLPQLTVRVARGVGASATQYATPATGDRLLTDDSLVLDVRVALSLDRLVFDPHEVAIAREESARTHQRLELEAAVVDLLARMERARLALAATDTDPARRAELALEYARARARLELLTGADLAALTRAR